MPGIRAIQISGKLYDDIPKDFQCSPNSTNSTATNDLVQVLWNFVAPFIFCVGFIGNLLILLVMTRTWMRGTSTSSYLIAMAIADMFVLVSGMIPEWLEANEMVTFKEEHPFTCKLEKFVFYTAGDTAIWIRVLFTIDRFVAVCFPMSTTEYCLYWKAKYYSFATLLAAMMKNFHVFFTRGAEIVVLDESTIEKCQNFLTNFDFNSSTLAESSNITAVVLISNCGGTSTANKYFEAFVRPWIAFSLVSILPFAILLILNLLIIRSLIEVKRTRAEHLLVTKSHDRHIFQMTAMCLSASFSFLVCVTPSMILLIGKPYWTKRGSNNSAYEIAKAINNQMYYIVHSVNFFLYCVAGKRFRDSLMALISGKRYSRFPSSIRSSVYSVGVLARNSLPASSPSSSVGKNDYTRVVSKENEASL